VRAAEADVRIHPRRSWKAAVIDAVVDAIAHKAVLEQHAARGPARGRPAYALVMSYLIRPDAG